MVQIHSFLLLLVEEVLFFEWDPLQVNSVLLLRDEYDIFAPDICRLLLDGAAESTLSQHLSELARAQSQQFKTDEERDRRVARRLLSLVVDSPIPAARPAYTSSTASNGPQEAAAVNRQFGYRYLVRRPLSNYNQYLVRRPLSNYNQLFLKSRKIRAEVIYRQTVGLEPRTPEEVAQDYDIPVEAVLEAIHYCVYNEPLLRKERDEEMAWIRAQGLDQPPHVPPDYKPEA
jgi:hypothetical protein